MGSLVDQFGYAIPDDSVDVTPKFLRADKKVLGPEGIIAGARAMGVHRLLWLPNNTPGAYTNTLDDCVIANIDDAHLTLGGAGQNTGHSWYPDGAYYGILRNYGAPLGPYGTARVWHVTFEMAGSTAPPVWAGIRLRFNYVDSLNYSDVYFPLWYSTTACQVAYNESVAGSFFQRVAANQSLVQYPGLGHCVCIEEDDTIYLGMWMCETDTTGDEISVNTSWTGFPRAHKSADGFNFYFGEYDSNHQLQVLSFEIMDIP